MDFVVGHPRSGTMLLSQLLNLGSAAASGHEVLVRLSGDRLLEIASAYYERRATADEVRALLDLYERDSFGIDCNWKLVWILPVLLERFPRARFVHVVREPHENIRSCFNLDYYGALTARREVIDSWPRDFGGMPLAWYTTMPRIDVGDWERMDAFERNCAFWAETHRLILRTIPPERVLRVSVERLDRSIEPLFEFLQLPRPSADDARGLLSRRVNAKPLEKHHIARFRDDLLGEPASWSAERQRTFTRRCEAIARELGYAS